jgi:colanic acid biosynthesis glycosyl transferase WcaI
MRILILTQYYPPEMGAPQARLHELATRLNRKGHSVSVLTGMPNYPTGKIFSGYRRKFRCRERFDGIDVTRVCLYPSNSSRILPRLLCYFSFSISCVLLGIWGVGRQDIILVESPPLFLAPVGWLISRLTQSKAILMVSDIWPDIIVRMKHIKEGLSLRSLSALEKWAYIQYDVVALTNPGAVTQVNERFPKVKTTVISNGVDTKFFRPDLRSEEIRRKLGAGPGTFLVAYCGLHGLAQGLDAVVEAAGYLSGNDDIHFAMVGDGPEKNALIRKAKGENLHNLFFFDRHDKKDMPGILASCDALLVPLVVRLPGTMPSKIYEAMASGTPPIVSAGCEGDFLVTKYQAGSVFPPLDGKSLAQIVEKMAGDPQLCQAYRQKCLEIAVRFDRDAIAERTECILEAIYSNQELPKVPW